MTNVRRTYKLINNQTGETVRTFHAGCKQSRISMVKNMMERKNNTTYTLKWFYNMDELYPHEIRELDRRFKEGKVQNIGM
jgi:hypothetical protein